MNTAHLTHDTDLNQVLSAALSRVDPYRMVQRVLRRVGSVLHVTDTASELHFDISQHDRILVIGYGKASARMAQAVLDIIGESTVEGMVITKYGHTVEGLSIPIYEAAHPVPDQAGVTAAVHLERLLSTTTERSLIINVISGGGSALLTAPYHDDHLSLTLEDLQETTGLLLGCGAEIGEINGIRKHLSAMKGGRLATLFAPSTSLNLILSDVVGDDLSAIASGTTVADPSSYADALAIAERYHITTRLPTRVRTLLQEGARGLHPETPDSRDPIFHRVHNIVIGSNRHALSAAHETASRLGYTTVTLTSRLTGEAKEVAKLFPAIACDALNHGTPTHPPLCVLTGGETTVTLCATPGRGGRNQELSLSVLREVMRLPTERHHITFASLATDGNDGPTDSAGGWFDPTISTAVGHDTTALDHALSTNSAYDYLATIGGHLVSGPTNTNVCDIQVLLIR